MQAAPSCSALQVAYQKASEFYEEANAANDAHSVHFIGRCLSQKVTIELTQHMATLSQCCAYQANPVPTALIHMCERAVQSECIRLGKPKAPSPCTWCFRQCLHRRSLAACYGLTLCKNRG